MTTQQEALRKVFEIIGSKSAVARYFGILPYAVSKWQHSGVPAERCPDIEKLTKGKVTCEELRPDVNWSVLRNSGK